MNNTLLDTAIGDVTSINMPIGQKTPAAGAFTTLSAITLTVNGIPADTGGTLAGNTTAAPAAITASTTNVTSADATHIAVVLPKGIAGDSRLVYNSGGASAQTISVYCASTDTIDGGSAGGNVTLTVAHRAARFYCVAANTWISEQVGAVST